MVKILNGDGSYTVIPVYARAFAPMLASWGVDDDVVDAIWDEDTGQDRDACGICGTKECDGNCMSEAQLDKLGEDDFHYGRHEDMVAPETIMEQSP